MTKSLVKLIDAAIIPAAVMICGKVAGLWLSNVIFDLNWNIVTDANDFFSVRLEYDTLDQQITATSYSNLLMFVFVFVGFLVVLAKALFFHSSHITPSMIAKLATNNLLNLIGDSFEIYYKASVWLIMLWLSLFAVVINVLLEKSYTWTGLLVVFCTTFATVILLRDVSKEIAIAKKNLPKLAKQNFNT